MLGPRWSGLYDEGELDFFEVSITRATQEHIRLQGKIEGSDMVILKASSKIDCLIVCYSMLTS